jgi:hypothetical protein
MPLSTIAIIYFVLAYGLKAGAIGNVSFVDWLISCERLHGFYICVNIKVISDEKILYSILCQANYIQSFTEDTWKIAYFLVIRGTEYTYECC